MLYVTVRFQMSDLLLAETINKGNLNNGPLPDVDTLHRIFLECLKGDTISKTRGWQHRLFSNYAYYLRVTYNSDIQESPEVCQEVRKLLTSMSGLEWTAENIGTILYRMFLERIEEKRYMNLPKETLIDLIRFRSAPETKSCVDLVMRIWRKAFVSLDFSPDDPSQGLILHLLTGRSNVKATDVEKHSFPNFYFMLAADFPPFPGPTNMDFNGDMVYDLICERMCVLSYEPQGYLTPKIKTMYNGALRNCNLTHAQMTTLNTLNPEIVPLPRGITIENFRQIGEKEWKLFKLPAATRAYVLGFPINMGIPGEAVIFRTLMSLARDGSDQLMLSMKARFPHMPNDYASLGLTQVSDRDFLDVKFSHLNSFDVVTCIADSTIYEFSRPNWKTIIESKMNPYTNLPLAMSVLEEIKHREFVANTYQLPVCKSINDLIDEPLTPREEVKHDPTPPSGLDEMLRLFGGIALMGGLRGSRDGQSQIHIDERVIPGVGSINNMMFSGPSTLPGGRRHPNNSRSRRQQEHTPPPMPSQLFPSELAASTSTASDTSNLPASAPRIPIIPPVPSSIPHVTPTPELEWSQMIDEDELLDIIRAAGEGHPMPNSDDDGDSDDGDSDDGESADNDN